ncbi:MAG: oligosaccharide flippase family protein [Terriglobia bacterium]
MGVKSLTAKNAITNYMGVAVAMVIGFLIAPFILHHLGDEAYGLYFLILSLTGYYGLLDLGIRSSVVKYVASYNATGDQEGLNRLINTTLFSYSVLGAFILVLTLVGSAYVDHFFRISPAFLRTARLLFVITGVGMAINFPLGVFSGILEGLQKFYLVNPVYITVYMLRAGLVVIFLERGYGLLTLALITVGVSAIGYNVGCAFLAVRATRIDWGFRFVNRKSLRLVINYGLITFAITLAGIIRGSVDNIVIGVFISSSAITFYSIGAKLVDYLPRLVRQLSHIFIPIASHLDATADARLIEKLFVEGNRACAFIVFPLAAILVIIGKPLIALWMGPKYVSSSYTILMILLVPTVLWFSQNASTQILYGLNRHKWIAKMRLADAIASLTLCLLLVKPFGITGVAVGLSIPWAVVSIFFFAPHLCKMFNAPLLRTLLRSYVVPLALTAPLAVILYSFEHWLPAAKLWILVLQAACAGAVYSAGLLWLFFTHEALGRQMRVRLVSRLKAATGR